MDCFFCSHFFFFLCFIIANTFIDVKDKKSKKNTTKNTRGGVSRSNVNRSNSGKSGKNRKSGQGMYFNCL